MTLNEAIKELEWYKIKFGENALLRIETEWDAEFHDSVIVSEVMEADNAK